MVGKFLWLLPGYPPPPVIYRRAGYLGGTSFCCLTRDFMFKVSLRKTPIRVNPRAFPEILQSPLTP